MFQKTEATMTESKVINSREKWKSRAKEKAREANLLRKQNKRLKESNLCWKSKFKQAIQNSSNPVATVSSEKIARHSYTSSMILLCLSLKLYAQQSVRSISKSISIWALVLGLEMKPPCHSTIHCWLRKAGYCRLDENKATEPGEWVIFIDESVCIGKEKLLLILGADVGKEKQSGMSFERVSCLYMASCSSWPAESIVKAITAVKEKLCGNICFAVVDKGNNINKALRLSGLCYIHDLTHEIAHRLSELYKEAQDFKAYCQWTALLRRQQALSAYAHLMPPEQKSKARFHNIEPLCQWGIAIEEKLELWKQQAPDLYASYKKIEEFKTLLHELQTLISLAEELKNKCYHGIKRSSLKDIYDLFDSLNTEREVLFAKKMKQYFKDSILRMNGQDIPICCSDIIESAFSKYKQMMPCSRLCGITDLALAIPAFMEEKWNKNSIKEAMEKVKVKDYKLWSQENMEPSLLKKRRNELPKTGT